MGYEEGCECIASKGRHFSTSVSPENSSQCKEMGSNRQSFLMLIVEWQL